MGVIINGSEVSNAIFENTPLTSMWLGPLQLWSSKELAAGDGVYMFNSDWFVLYANSSEVYVTKADYVATGLYFGEYKYLSGGVNSSIQSYYSGLTDTTTKGFLKSITVKNEYYSHANTYLSYSDSTTATQYMFAVSADEWHNNNGASVSLIARDTWGIGVTCNYRSTRTSHETSRGTPCRPHCIFGVGEDVDFYHQDNGGANDSVAVRSAYPCAILDLTKCKLKWNSSTKRWIPSPIKEEEFDFDLELPMPASKEIDFLYTSDIHCSYVNHYEANSKGYVPVFSMGVDADNSDNGEATESDIANYQSKLVNAGIPTLLLDSGDFSQCGTETLKQQQYVISRYKDLDYFAVVPGNHEWEHYSDSTTHKWDPEYSLTLWRGMESDNKKRILACNLFHKENGVYVQPFKPYKTIKVGDKKIGIIGVANSAFYSSSYPVGYTEDNIQNYYNSSSCPAQPEGQTGYNSGWWYFERWYDNHSEPRYDGWSIDKNFIMYDSVDDESTQSSGGATNTNLYKLVQHYINYLKVENKFDYVFVLFHSSPRNAEAWRGNDGYSKPEYLAKNTTGIDVILPGHLNQSWKEVSEGGTITGYDGLICQDAAGNNCFVTPEAGAALSSFGRLRLKFGETSDEISANLLWKREQLEEI